MPEREPGWRTEWACTALCAVAVLTIFVHVSIEVFATIAGYKANPPHGYVKIHIISRGGGSDEFVAPWIAYLYDYTFVILTVSGVLVIIWNIVKRCRPQA